VWWLRRSRRLFLTAQLSPLTPYIWHIAEPFPILDECCHDGSVSVDECRRDYQLREMKLGKAN